MIEGLALQLGATPTEDDVTTLKKNLDAHTAEAAAPLYADQALTVFLKDADGRMQAGLIGKTFWNWLYVDLLWVDPARRGQKLGAALVQAAEAEARRRGCVGAYLWTQSWQAPGFYHKQGFQPFVQFPDFPVGHARIGLMKKFSTHDAEEKAVSHRG